MTTGAGESATQRYTQSHPCPVCGGWESLPRGQGRRCDGYLFGAGAYCAREQGGKHHPSADLYWHRLSDEKHDGRPTARPARRVVATYPYTDERGELLYEVVRYEPKGFGQRRPDGQGGHVWSVAGVRLVPYRLPELLNAIAAGDAVYIVEGEKDADAMHAAGVVVTCNPMGAGKWRDEFSAPFAAAPDVRVVMDRDAPGRAHGVKVAQALRAVGASVRLFEPAHGKDAADHLAAGKTPDELVEIAPLDDAAGPAPEPPAGGARLVPLHHVSFSGARLAALLDRPKPDPVHAGIPPAGHFTLIVAPPISGKTSLELWLAMAMASGVPPWRGAPTLGPGRVLILSLDEAPERVYRRMHGFATFHPGGPLDRYNQRFEIVGPDRDIDSSALEKLRLDEAGLANLEHWIADAAAEQRPFAGVFIDAYADVLPLGESENSNEEATRIGGALERLAVRHGCAVCLIHHAGKPAKDADGQPPDLRYMGRGASALGAKARTIFSVELVSGLPHMRRIRTQTNLDRSPPEALFTVCSKESSGDELLFFRPSDPVADYSPNDYLQPGEQITTEELARRLSPQPLPDDARPGGALRDLATTLRERWCSSGLVDVIAGPRNSKLTKLSGLSGPERPKATGPDPASGSGLSGLPLKGERPLSGHSQDARFPGADRDELGHSTQELEPL